ncbi:uncharacterized protein LTR77_005060 [Saxophila tyrrhenica]|uniref:Zn(2)-C6 fungal-type domain-containing protein n=1 Tax=Saxophila tyrrhenica TaxID=1690608 RepID=A0AAV9PAY5_9PEZI|nr:hypothetical protein LTR77_005060 [Saxophila tyrrhenica]
MKQWNNLSADMLSKAKKACDQELPACGRCVRLGKACGGYRDLTSLLFKDETPDIIRRASSQSESGLSSVSTPTRLSSSEDRDTAAKAFFFREFVSPVQLSFLDPAAVDGFLEQPIVACALAAMSNRDNDVQAREASRRCYIEAINATQVALRDTSKATEDSTLIAVCLLSIFERISWDHHTSMTSWGLHVEGSAQGFFVSYDSIFAVSSETEVPEHIIEWTRELEFDPILSPGDELDLLGARLASIRSAFCNRTKPDVELEELSQALENDLISWAERAQAPGSPCAFQSRHDQGSPNAWNGIHHDYSSPQALRYWNKWRCYRIPLSRLQEELWRRSWPALAQTSRRVPDSEHYRRIRGEMMADICTAAASLLGNDVASEPARGMLANAYPLVLPLSVAGTCLLQELVQPVLTPEGSRVILLDRPLHLNLFDQRSTQLAWVIDRLDFISGKIGIKWAAAWSRWLRGEDSISYDTARSVIVQGGASNELERGQLLDLGI